QVGRQPLRHRHRAGARAAAAVGDGEGLVQVHVHDVEPHVAGASHTQDGVQVGAVVVEQAADLVRGRGDLGDVLLEETEGVGVGEHDPGDVGVEALAEGGHVDHPTLV